MTERNYIYALTVTRVIDGDTIVGDLDVGFEIVFENRKFRLYGIDTAEMNSKDATERERAQAAKYYVEQKILGRHVLAQTFKNKLGADTVDSFGRYLARIYYTESDTQKCLNDELLFLGLAKEYEK